MKILILTQKVNQNDTVLGFFHGWISEFAKKFSSITVVCLEKGEYELPKNVSVFSLGKEKGRSRIKYILNFYKYIFRERKDYDAVFVHMNQEYILLGALFWKMMKKNVVMWRNHHAGGLLTYLSVLFCDKVFCTSRYSYTAKFKKTEIMPVGIDTDTFFRKNELFPKTDVLYLGRFAPVKKPHLLVDALKLLSDKKISVDFYGSYLRTDNNYYQSLQKEVKDSGLENLVNFYDGVPYKEIPDICNKHNVLVNLSPDGMYDKTIFEAASCERLVLASNGNLKGQIDDIFVLDKDMVNAEGVARKLEGLLALPPEVKADHGRRLREYVVRHHSLTLLADILKQKIEAIK